MLTATARGDERDEGQQVLGLGDRPRVDRRREEPVEQERGGDRARDRGPDAADGPDREHEDEVEEHIGREAEGPARGGEREREQRQPDEGEREAPRPGGREEARRARVARFGAPPPAGAAFEITCTSIAPERRMTRLMTEPRSSSVNRDRSLAPSTT